MALLRYPGSKERIRDKIVRHFPHELYGGLFAKDRLEYREPFFGGGSVGLHVLERMDSHGAAWLSDLDPGVAALWRAIRDEPRQLKCLVRGFTPSVDAFAEFKESDGQVDGYDHERGFRKLALHRMSYSGMGAMAGGPIGGASQSSDYGVGCRWNPASICREIDRIHGVMKRAHRVSVTCVDYHHLIDNASAGEFIYLDPPYVAAGPALYKHSFTDEDHRRLSLALKLCAARWVLSYDDHPLVRSLYGDWCRIEPVDVTYTTATAKKPRRATSTEIVILPRESR
jgi:DNA adenine methylase